MKNSLQVGTRRVQTIIIACSVVTNNSDCDYMYASVLNYFIVLEKLYYRKRNVLNQQSKQEISNQTSF